MIRAAFLSFLLTAVLMAAPGDALPGFPSLASGKDSLTIPLQIVVLLTALTMLPAVLVSLTPFLRISVVLHFLRQALGTQTAPSNQVMLGLALFLMILAAFGAELIHLEPIVGAFMVGLAIGPVTRHAKGFEHFEFIGQSFFIPIFFISIGFHINLGVFVVTLIDNAPLVIAIVGGLIASKLGAALITRRLYRFSADEGLLMWSVSLPRVAATLAAALVAYGTVNQQGERLIDEPILNTIIVLMVEQVTFTFSHLAEVNTIERQERLMQLPATQSVQSTSVQVLSQAS